MKKQAVNQPSTDESLCKKCGRCCFIKTQVHGVAYFTNIPCNNFDPNTKLCKVYEKRYRIKGGCIPWKHAIEIHALPQDCPYVKDIPGYVGPKPFFELAMLVAELKKRLSNKPS